MPGMTKRRGWEAMASEAREMGVGGVCHQDRGYLSIEFIALSDVSCHEVLLRETHVCDFPPLRWRTEVGVGAWW